MRRSVLICCLLFLCTALPRTVRASEPPPASGAIAGWGSNEWGQIDPATCCNPKHVPVNGPSGQWTSIAAGERVTVASRFDGTVWEWGQSDSSTACTLLCLPGPVASLHNVVGVATSLLDVRLALESDGTVWQWQSSRQQPPFRVAGLPRVVQIAVGGWFALALGDDGSVWRWSYTSDPNAAVQPQLVAGLPPASAIAAGTSNGLAVSRSGEVWTWNDPGSFGNGSSPPVLVPGPTGILAVAAGDRFSLALGGDGRVWSWGDDAFGELGRGSSGPTIETPALIPTLQDITAISAQSFHALVLRSDGTVWAWGDNQHGQAGNGAISPYGPGCGCISTPVEAVGLTDAFAISAGGDFNVALLAAPLLVPLPLELGPCGPPPGPVPGAQHVPLSVPVGETPSQIAVSDRLHRLFLLRPGQYDSAADTYTCAGSVAVLDSRGGEPVATPVTGKNPIQLILDDRANRFFVVDGGARDDALHGDIRVFNASTGKLVALVPFDGLPGSAALAVHAGHLFVPLTDVPSTANHLALAMLGTGTGRILSFLPISVPEDTPVVDEASNRLFFHDVIGGVTSVVALSASTGQQVGTLTRFRCSGDLYDDAADGRLIALLEGSDHNGVGSLCILNPRTLHTTGGYVYGPNRGAYLLLIDGRAHLLVLAEQEYGPQLPPPGATVRDARTGRLIHQLKSKFVLVIADPSTGDLISLKERFTVGGVKRNSQIAIIDPHTWRIIRRFQIPSGPVQLTVQQKPHRLIVLSRSGNSAELTFINL